MKWPFLIRSFICLVALTNIGCKRTEGFYGAETPQPQILQDSRSLSENESRPPQEENSNEVDQVDESHQESAEVPSPANPYQLGDEWNRTPTPAFHENHWTVLRGTVSTESGLISSNFIFVKRLNELEGLFVTTRHSLPRCNEEGVVFYTKEKKLHGFCSGIFEVVPETDSVIVSIEFFEPKDLEILIPVKFAARAAGGERVRFFGIESDQYIPGYYPLVSDSSPDCLLLSSEERRISDPDSAHPVEGELWSVPISCDIQHGDSGGMIVNRSNELVGIVWTGAFPKSSARTSKELMSLVDVRDSEILWSDFNYAVPAYRIQAQLQVIESEVLLK